MNEKHEVTRRNFLRGAATAVAGAAIPIRFAHAQQKASKQAMQYQDTPKNGQQCDQCMHFEAPKSCKIVAGDISPKGWCVAFAKKQ
jgi:anaerobic selenocysteine-containing dehydrogenase